MGVELPGVVVEIRGDYSQLKTDLDGARDAVRAQARGMSDALNNALSPRQIQGSINGLVNSLGQINRGLKTTEGAINNVSADLGEFAKVTGLSEKELSALQQQMLQTKAQRQMESAMNRVQRATGASNLQMVAMRAKMGDLTGASRQFGQVAATQFGRAKSSIFSLQTAMAGLGVGLAVKRTLDSFSALDEGLIGVKKTTGLAGKELEAFGAQIQDLSMVMPTSSKELLAIAQSAGQLGVKGSKNLLAFSKTVAQLGTASDLAGEEAATALARMLNVAGESADEVETLGSVIVALGNNMAATESEIAKVGTEIGQATAAFRVSSAEAAAMGAALRSMGVRAELGGSAVGRTFRAIDAAIRGGGESMQELEKLTGKTGKQLEKTFSEDSAQVFQWFVEGLGKVMKGGGSASEALESFGLKGEEILKVLPTIAMRSESLGEALGIAAKETRNATALTVEAMEASKSFSAQMQMTGNTIDAIAADIGRELAPAIVEVAGDFRDWVKDNREFLKQDVAGHVRGIGEAFGGLAESIGSLASKWNSLPEAFQSVLIGGAAGFALGGPTGARYGAALGGIAHLFDNVGDSFGALKEMSFGEWLAAGGGGANPAEFLKKRREQSERIAKDQAPPEIGTAMDLDLAAEFEAQSRKKTPPPTTAPGSGSDDTDAALAKKLAAWEGYERSLQIITAEASEKRTLRIKQEFEDRRNELEGFLKAGKISEEDHARWLAELKSAEARELAQVEEREREKRERLRKEEARSAEELAKKHAEEISEEARETAKAFEKAWENAIDRVDNAFADMWERFFDGGRLALNDFTDIFKKYLAEWAHAAVTRPIVVQLATATTGMGGFGLPGGGALPSVWTYFTGESGGASPAGGAASGGAGGLTSNIPFGSLMPSSWTAGLNSWGASAMPGVFASSSATTSAGLLEMAAATNNPALANALTINASAAPAATMMGTLGAAGLGFLGGNLIGGLVGDSTMGGIGGGAGAGIGMAVGGPVGGIIGGIIGGLGGGFLGGLFGGDDEPPPQPAVQAHAINVPWGASGKTYSQNVKDRSWESFGGDSSGLTNLWDFVGETAASQQKQLNEIVSNSLPDDLAHGLRGVLSNSVISFGQDIPDSAGNPMDEKSWYWTDETDWEKVPDEVAADIKDAMWVHLAKSMRRMDWTEVPFEVGEYLKKPITGASSAFEGILKNVASSTTGHADTAAYQAMQVALGVDADIKEPWHVRQTLMFSESDRLATADEDYRKALAESLATSENEFIKGLLTDVEADLGKTFERSAEGIAANLEAITQAFLAAVSSETGVAVEDMEYTSAAKLIGEKVDIQAAQDFFENYAKWNQINDEINAVLDPVPALKSALDAVNDRFDQYADTLAEIGAKAEKAAEIEAKRVEVLAETERQLAQSFDQSMELRRLSRTDPDAVRMREFELQQQAELDQAIASFGEESGRVFMLKRLQDQELLDYQLSEAYRQATEARSAYMAALSTEQAELQSTISNMRRFVDDLHKLRRDLVLNKDLSTSSVDERYAYASAQIQDMYAKAMGGDEEAIKELQGLSKQYLETSKDYNANFSAYRNDFDRVQQMLADVEGHASDQASAAEDQMDAIRDLVSSLDEYSTTITSSMDELATRFEEAVANLKQVSAVVESSGGSGSGGGGEGSGSGASHQGLLNSMYHEVFGRDVDSGGAEYYSGLIESGMSPSDVYDELVYNRDYHGARAAGGPVGPGTWLVGEQGPELLRMGTAGHVYDAQTTKQLMGGGKSPGLLEAFQHLLQEVRELRASNQAGQSVIARNTRKVADTQRKWDTEGKPKDRDY